MAQAKKPCKGKSRMDSFYAMKLDLTPASFLATPVGGGFLNTIPRPEPDLS